MACLLALRAVRHAPPVDGRVSHGDAAFQQAFFDIARAQGGATDQRMPISMPSWGQWAPGHPTAIVAFPHDAPLLREEEHTASRLISTLRHTWHGPRDTPTQDHRLGKGTRRLACFRNPSAFCIAVLRQQSVKRLVVLSHGTREYRWPVHDRLRTPCDITPRLSRSTTTHEY